MPAGVLASPRHDLTQPTMSTEHSKGCRWKDGDLMTFSSSAFHHAELGLSTTSLADHLNIVWMSRITLPAVE